MNKEEIEELKDFTIDLTDIDELALGLEVCSEKSNMVIQEFANTIIQLQQENKQLKEQTDRYKKLIEYLKKLDFYEFELDYDYEENPIDNYYPADMEYHINNWLANEELERSDSDEI